MPTVFETLTEQFWVTFFQSDPIECQEDMNAWLDAASPTIQESVTDELKSYLQCVLEPRQTQEGWESGVNKFRRLIGDYQLVLDIKLRKVGSNEEPKIVGPVSPKMRGQTLEIADRVIADFDASRNPHPEQVSSESEDHPDSSPNSIGGSRSGSLSPPHGNNQRSDSLNPNNPSFRASANNRSNQLNPNNPAYRSSRGRR